MPFQIGDLVCAARDIRFVFKVVVPAATEGTIVGGGWYDGTTCGNPDGNLHWDVRWDNGRTWHVSESDFG